MRGLGPARRGGFLRGFGPARRGGEGFAGCRPRTARSFCFGKRTQNHGRPGVALRVPLPQSRFLGLRNSLRSNSPRLPIRIRDWGAAAPAGALRWRHLMARVGMLKTTTTTLDARLREHAPFCQPRSPVVGLRFANPTYGLLSDECGFGLLQRRPGWVERHPHPAATAGCTLSRRCRVSDPGVSKTRHPNRACLHEWLTNQNHYRGSSCRSD